MLSAGAWEEIGEGPVASLVMGEGQLVRGKALPLALQRVLAIGAYV